MFSLLVDWNVTAWEQPTGAMDVTRFKEYSAASADTISVADPASLRQLENTPALLMYEVANYAPTAQIVRLGTLTNVRVVGAEIRFNFSPAARPFLKRGDVLEMAGQLGMHHFEQYRTHWAIKDNDIPQELINKATAEPPLRTVTQVMTEYAEAQLNNADTTHLLNELRAAPASQEKALAVLRHKALEHGLPELFPLLGMKKSDPLARDAWAALSLKNTLDDVSMDWPFSYAWFLGSYGTPTESEEVRDVLHQCGGIIAELTAAGDATRPAKWPKVHNISKVLWRSARSPVVAQKLRRRTSLLIDQLVSRQRADGSWSENKNADQIRSTALAVVAIQRNGDDKYRPQIKAALFWLLGKRSLNGFWPKEAVNVGDVVATVFALEALRRSELRDELLHIVEPADHWLLEAQTDLGLWEADEWDSKELTCVVLDYLERRENILPQVDGFLLMARDFFRSAEEFQISGGLNNRRLAVIAVIHALEMFLYGIFERRADFEVSFYRDDNKTLGFREAMAELRRAIRTNSGTTANLKHWDRLKSLATYRDNVIHQAHEISQEELDKGIIAAREFIEKYGAELLSLDLLQ